MLPAGTCPGERGRGQDRNYGNGLERAPAHTGLPEPVHHGSIQTNPTGAFDDPESGAFAKEGPGAGAVDDSL